MLEGVFGVLQWDGDRRAALDVAESRYTSLLATRTGGALAELRTADPDRAAVLLERLTRLDLAATRRVLLAPETSSRLLWDHPGHCDRREFGQFLLDSVDVECARMAAATGAPSATSPGPVRWSALGDVAVDQTGAIVASQPRVGGMVIDADSPAAVCFDGSSLYSGPMRLYHYGDGADRAEAGRKMDAAMHAIDAFDSDVADFVRRFTLVANIIVDGERARFSSGSTGEYIGRSMFINAHAAAVDCERLTDSLVHEAIHSLLYMHEVCSPWVVREEILPPNPVIESPWTGASLLLRNFLQACCVWFGLTHFWSRAQHRGIDVQSTTDRRMPNHRPSRVSEGFAPRPNGPVRAPCRPAIARTSRHDAGTRRRPAPSVDCGVSRV